MPRDLADLSYARFLVTCDTAPEPDTDYDSVHLDALTVDDMAAGGSRFTESAFTGVTFVGGAWQSARFDDVWLRAVRMIGTNVGQSNWLNSEFVDSALSGVEAVDARLRRVRFEGCKFESVNLRAAVLQDVTFSDCVLRDTDFGAAMLTRVQFPGSRLEDVALRGSTLHEVDLRGAADLQIIGDIGALRGATVSTAQLFDLAPAFAQAAGIIVRDDRDPAEDGAAQRV